MEINRWFFLALLCVAALASAAQREPGLYARFETSMGNITVKLYEAEAPITVKNFVDLAEGKKAWVDPNTGQKVLRPLYNGVIFHRVIPNFMIQGGDPTGTGTYSPGFTLPDEIVSSLKFDRPGRLAVSSSSPRCLTQASTTGTRSLGRWSRDRTWFRRLRGFPPAQMTNHGRL
jgi:cyclophilin family peptidyl-prolyl cis-trans isomerase